MAGGPRIAMLLALAAPCLSYLSSSRQGCRADADLVPGSVYTGSLMWTETGLPTVNRTFHVYVPHGYRRGKGHATVLHYHDWGHDALEAHKEGGWKRAADRFNVLMVYPDGMADCMHGKCRGQRSWNAGGASQSDERDWTCDEKSQTESFCYASCVEKKENGCHACDYSTCFDDVGFTRKLLELTKGQFCVDEKRVFAAGCGNGGQLAHDLGKRMPDELAAVSLMCGASTHAHFGLGKPQAYASMPIMHFSRPGKEARPEALAAKLASHRFETRDLMMDMWKDYNKCQSAAKDDAKDYSSGATRCSRAGSDCTDGAQVVVCESSESDRAEDASAVITFFLDHPRLKRPVIPKEEVDEEAIELDGRNFHDPSEEASHTTPNPQDLTSTRVPWEVRKAEWDRASEMAKPYPGAAPAPAPWANIKMGSEALQDVKRFLKGTFKIAL